MYKINFTVNIIIIILALPLIIEAQYKLKVGNFWIYNNDYTEEKISVVDTVTLFDSLSFFKLKKEYLRKSGFLNYYTDSTDIERYIRVRKDNLFESIYVYNLIKDTIVQPYVYKKDAKLADKWIYRISNEGTPYDTVWAEVVDVFDGIVFGEWRTVKKIRYRTGFDFFKYFCDDFGELSEEGYDYVSHILRGCYIDSIAYGDTSFLVVSVEDDLLPSEFILSQNYPNPFNPSTLISYSIPKSANIELILYDIKGEEVAVLIDEIQRAGNYRINFDASKFNLSSGIYFYQLVSGEFSQAKKMILLR